MLAAIALEHDIILDMTTKDFRTKEKRYGYSITIKSNRHFALL